LLFVIWDFILKMLLILTFLNPQSAIR